MLKFDKTVAVFVAILVIGLPAISILYGRSELASPHLPLAEQLDDREKQLISAEGEMSKWLLGIATGAMGGLVVLRLKDPRRSGLHGIIPMAAHGFLLLSIFGAFLSYQATFNILRTGPLNYLYGDQFAVPVLIQFWTLIVALVLLGLWLLQRTRASHLTALIVLFLMALPLMAQKTETSDCLNHWYSDRFGPAESAPTYATSVLRELQAQQKSQFELSCTDANVIFDKLRYASVDAGNPDSPAAFSKYLLSLDKELQSPKLSQSEIVQAIVQAMAIWDRSFGVLEVRSTKGTCTVLMDGAVVGLTNWQTRLRPGKYSIRVVRNYKVIYSADEIKIRPGEAMSIDAESDPK